VQPIGCRLSPQTRASLTAKETTTRTVPVCRLMVSIPVIHVFTWITTHLPTPKGWKAELTWLVDL